MRARSSVADQDVELVDFGDEDEEDERGASPVGFSSMRDYAAEVDAIDAAASKHIDAILSELSVSPGGTSSSLDAFLATEFDDDRIDTSRMQAGERTVPGFASHQPEFKQQLVAKKLRLLEKQVERRDKQLARLATAHKQATSTIDKLQRDLKSTQEELETAQKEWEEERESILRFRGAGGGGNNNQGFAVPIVLGSAKRGGNDAETQRQRELKLQMMMKGAAEAREMLEDADGLNGEMGGAGARGFGLMLKKARFFIRRRLDPYASDIRQIEARFGYSVASYFRFLVWIIKTFMILASTGTTFLVLHIYYQVKMQEFTGSSVNWFAFSGIIPTILAFPGYHSGEALMYTAALLVLEGLLLLFTLRKWVVEDRRAKAIEAVDRSTLQPRYGKIVLNAWDFSITNAEQASDLRKSVAEQLKVTMEEEKILEKLKLRTKREWYVLYARRVIVFNLYLALQASSWYVIVILTTQSAQLQMLLSLKAPVLATYSSSIVPAAVTVINSLLPTVISLLTSLEKWDDVGFAIKVMVTRLYLAKVLNVLIQLFSFALLLNPYLLTSLQTFMGLITFNGATVRTNVMVEFKPSSYACRTEQVAAGLLTLVVTDFAVSKIMAIVSPFIGLALKIVKSIVHFWNEKRIDKKRTKQKAKATVIPVPTQDEPVPNSAENHSPTPASIETGQAENKPDNALSEQVVPKTEESPQQMPTNEEPSVSKSPAQEKGKLASRVSRLHALHDLMPRAEFQVPQKMVAMLYSCTIALLAVPLAPPVIIIAVLIHSINFKFDKFILMRFQKKPTNPWSAKDAGSFFVKFYFCTVLIFVVFAHYVLLNEDLAKQCDLQDSALLCVSNTFDTATETCELSISEPSAEYFQSSDECTNGYPRCVCAYQCGPFTGVSSGMAPFWSVVESINAVASLYSLIIDNKTVSWGMLLALGLALLLMRNSLRVLVMVTLQRESEVAWTLTSLRKKIKQLENRLRIHKVTADKDTA